MQGLGEMIPATADLYDRFKGDARYAEAGLRDFGGRMQFSGTAVTIRCFEDNSRLKECSTQPGQGKVLVVDGGGSRRCALIGDVIAADCANNGWEGVVVLGCVRDVAALRSVDLGIRALGSVPRASVRAGMGDIGQPVGILGAVCHPGDFVVVDEDGIVFLSAAQRQALAEI
jgi:regulator of ribonuclease activity A